MLYTPLQLMINLLCLWCREMERRVERMREVCRDQGTNIKNPKKVFKYNRFGVFNFYLYASAIL